MLGFSGSKFYFVCGKKFYITVTFCKIELPSVITQLYSKKYRVSGQYSEKTAGKTGETHHFKIIKMCT